MEIKDNAFSRQFETTTAQGLVGRILLSRKENILTKIHAPDGYEDEEFLTDFLKHNGNCNRTKIKVVPILPKIVVF
jgi:hypothetical protein